MGFTQESKFNLWESLTPEPLLHQLLQMSESVTADDVSGIGTTYPSTFLLYTKKLPCNQMRDSLLSGTYYGIIPIQID